MENKQEVIEEINGCRRALKVYFNDSEYAANTVERLIIAHIKLAKIVGE